MTHFFSAWCGTPQEDGVGGRSSRLLESNDDEVGVRASVDLLPSAYARSENLSRIAERHGKIGVARLLKTKSPQTQRARSGDLGEILGTAYVQTVMGFKTGPSRLIERDHQEWAMRGDDILAARCIGDSVTLVKVEAKSRARANKATIEEARAGLLRNDDLASAHSLTQFAERLLEEDEILSDAVNDLLQQEGLRPHHFRHMMFIFAGNHPLTDIRHDLDTYEGPVEQTTVTIKVQQHQEFVRRTFTEATSHAS